MDGMANVSAFTAKRLFAQLIPRARGGEEIVITRHGKAVARLVPAAAEPKDAARAAFRRLRERAKRSDLRKIDWLEWRGYRDRP
jgi:prevent-host-death family protein